MGKERTVSQKNTRNWVSFSRKPNREGKGQRTLDLRVKETRHNPRLHTP